VEYSIFHDLTEVQLLKIDLGSFMELFSWCLELGERGLLGRVFIQVYSLSSLWVVLSCFPSLQGCSCCACFDFCVIQGS